jgi:hypothetical protein
MGSFNNDLAANGNLGGFNPVQLFSGEKPVTTNHAAMLRNQTFAKFTVVAYSAAGLLVPWAPAAADSSAIIAGVIAQPIASGATDDTVMAQFYDGGVFNYELAVFVNAATLQKVKAAQAGRTLQFEKLYG